MAVERLEDIAALLVAYGRAPEEPAAVIERATTPRQRVVSGSLSDIARLARSNGLEPPAVLVVGPTVGVADMLSGAPERELVTA
jgi:siroheme synthase